MSNMDEDMQTLFGMMDEQCIEIEDDDDQIPYAYRCEGVTIKYEGLRPEYMKTHKKMTKQQKSEHVGKHSWMRMKEARLEILIENKMMPGLPIGKVVVRRTKSAYAEARQMNEGENKIVKGEVSIPYESRQVDLTSWKLSLDLDSVYLATEDGREKEVFALCPSNIEATNKFQLVTEMYVRQRDPFGKDTDVLIGKKESMPFLIRTEPRNPKPRLQSIGETNSEGYSPKSSPESPPQNALQDAAYNNLEARNAVIGMLSAQVIKTHNADIAYHIPLKDFSQKGDFKEGDVVGFLEDDKNKTVIAKLDKENYKRAKLAGVITRSCYLEGQFPKSIEVVSDKVCVIGIVKVRVLGPVQNGDQLYAFPKLPGVAATYSRISLDKQDKDDRPLFLGQALESRLDIDFDEVSLIPSFVSVVNGIDYLAMVEKVSDLNEKFHAIVNSKVGAATKKMKRRLFWLKILLLLVLTTIGLALWQRYAPNTLLRRSICKRGSLNEQTMTISYNTSWEKIPITGLEFTFKNLKEKLYNSDDLAARKGKQMRYFLSYRRCCNRGVSYGNKYADDTPTVAGPEILSSDAKCSPHSIRYLNDGRWVPLQTAKRRITVKHCNGHL